jgi:hypothetical protein
MSQVTLTKEMLKGLSVDELLDLSVDQLATVQPFQPRPTGIYRFEVLSCGVEEVGEGNAIVVKYKLHECIELEKEEEAELVGELPAEYTESYFIAGDSDFGIRTFRTIFAGVIGEGEDVSVREQMARSVGVTGEGLLKHRKWKNKETKEMKEGNQWEPTSIVLA